MVATDVYSTPNFTKILAISFKNLNRTAVIKKTDWLTSFRSAPSRWTSETDWHSIHSLFALPYHKASQQLITQTHTYL